MGLCPVRSVEAQRLLHLPPSRGLLIARLIARLRDQGIACLRLEHAFSEAGSAEELHYARDGHWNPRGHHLAAELLRHFLQEQSLL